MRNITIEKRTNEYEIYEKENLIVNLCVEEFNKVIQITGIKNWKTFESMKVESVKFVGLRKATENSKDCFFLTKDKDAYEFAIWENNPSIDYDKEIKRFTGDNGGLIMEFKKLWFERVTGVRKQAILKIGDVYRFNRIEIKVRRIR